MKRIITVILVLSIVFAMATPTFAYEETKHQDNITDGNHTLPISVVTVDNGNFYIEETDAYRLVVGIVGEKVDCSVCYFSAPNVVHSLNELLSDDYKGKDDKEIFAYYSNCF